MGHEVIVADANDAPMDAQRTHRITVHVHENYENHGVPAFNFDRAQTIASIERMKQIVGNVKATVIIQHDMRDIGKLPAFPAAAK